MLKTNLTTAKGPVGAVQVTAAQSAIVGSHAAPDAYVHVAGSANTLPQTRVRFLGILSTRTENLQASSIQPIDLNDLRSIHLDKAYTLRFRYAEDYFSNHQARPVKVELKAELDKIGVVRRTLGSAAQSIAMVAGKGRDAAVVTANHYDVVAALLVAKEAGATISQHVINREAGEFTVYIVAESTLLHDRLVAGLANVLKQKESEV